MPGCVVVTRMGQQRQDDKGRGGPNFTFRAAAMTRLHDFLYA